MSAQVLRLPLPQIAAIPLAEQLPAGRLTEIVRMPAGAQLSLAASCVAGAQARGEPVAWVQHAGGSLFPPDLAESGVDIEALLIVNVPLTLQEHPRSEAQRSDPRWGGTLTAPPAGRGGRVPSPVIKASLCKAAEVLLRSGGFGLVVIDLVIGSGTNDELPLQAQSRLLGLAREHDSAVLLLSDGPRQGSLGPLVGLCIEPRRQRVGRAAFLIEPHARKDKAGSLCALASEPRRSPWGLL